MMPERVTPAGDVDTTIGDATYSPEDNKLRIYAYARLDADTYRRVKAAGFIWAPKQDLFVAPMWTPDRVDLCTELCGEIGDEDRSLVERAEERADRFDGYQEHRTRDAERAQTEVSRITDGIPLGQPILVGHHSERHARKDAERIENGMRKAIKMWDTAAYWHARAAGAIRHAKYKELPGVRARRIKGIEADRRKQIKITERAEGLIARWSKPLDTPGQDGIADSRRRVIGLANMDGGTYARHHEYRRRDETGREVGDVYHTGPLSLWEAAGGNSREYDPNVCAVATPEEIRDRAIRNHQGAMNWAARWIAHYDNRLAYERAMLAESGGLITDRSEYPIVPGGRVLVRGEWVTVIRVNRTEGKICSVTTNARYVSVRGIEQVQDYQPPTAEAAQAVKRATKQPPIINEDVPGAVHKTKTEFDDRRKHSDFWHYMRVKAEGPYAAYRQAAGWWGGQQVVIFFTDQPVKPRPLADETIERPTLPAPERVVRLPVLTDEDAANRRPSAQAEEIAAMRETLRVGVQVVSAPQLFPTPADVARQVVELADVRKGNRVLEPSAGTGALLHALVETYDRRNLAPLVAVEINHALADRLRREYPYASIFSGVDFLTLTRADLGEFDRIVMNPPFVHGADIKHIQHARGMLAPGGRLVTVCANGSRQHAAFRDQAEMWIDLPDGTFSEQGTNVRTAILVLAAVDGQ